MRHELVAADLLQLALAAVEAGARGRRRLVMVVRLVARVLALGAVEEVFMLALAARASLSLSLSSRASRTGGEIAVQRLDTFF